MTGSRRSDELQDGDEHMTESIGASGGGLQPIVSTEITNDEVTSTLQRLASNVGVDERLDVSPDEMARMVESNARFRATMGPMPVDAMLSLRDEFQSAFDSVGESSGTTAAPSSAIAEQVSLFQSEMPDLTRVYTFSDTTYVVNPSSNTGIAVRSGADGISFDVHSDPTIDDAHALAEQCIKRAKEAEKELSISERRYKNLKDNVNTKVAEKAGYYKKYAKMVTRILFVLSMQCEI